MRFLLGRHSLVAALALIAVVMFALIPAMPAGAATPDRTRYTIDAAIDFGAKTVAAHQQVHFVNRTGTTLPDLVLTVTPANWKGFTLNGATIDGKTVPTKLDGVMLTVSLPAPLPPNGAADLELAFRLAVPEQGGRYGHSAGVMALGNWFPIMAVYRAGRLADPDLPVGWDRHRYVDTGDAFFTETADYAVRVTTDPAVTVAHTGDLVKREGGEWQFRAEGVRDFGLALSDRYETSSKQVGDVTVTTYILPGHRQMAPLYLRAASEMLAWASKYVGPYPYRSLDVAEVGAGSNGTSVGQEYPNLVFISSGPTSAGGGIDSYLAYLVMHEVAHQWFYGLIGDDQIHEPWLDEAFATWLSLHFYRQNYPDLFPAMWRSRILGQLGDVRGRIAGMPINSSIYDYKDEGLYFTVVYRQGAVFLEEVYQKVGEATMHQVLQRFYQIYRGRIATGSGFLDLLQSATSINLSPLIAEYFSYLRYQQPEPSKLSLIAPDAVGGATLSIELRSDQPLTKADVFVDDVLAWTGVPSDTINVRVDSFDAGEHLLTVVGSDARGRRVDRAATFQRIVVPTPTPTAVPTDTPTPTSTAAITPTASATPVAGVGCCGGTTGSGGASVIHSLETAVGLPLRTPRQMAIVGAMGGIASLGLVWMTLRYLVR